MLGLPLSPQHGPIRWGAALYLAPFFWRPCQGAQGVRLLPQLLYVSQREKSDPNILLAADSPTSKKWGLTDEHFRPPYARQPSSGLVRGTFAPPCQGGNVSRRCVPAHPSLSVNVITIPSLKIFPHGLLLVVPLRVCQFLSFLQYVCMRGCCRSTEEELSRALFYNYMAGESQSL